MDGASSASSSQHANAKQHSCMAVAALESKTQIFLSVVSLRLFQNSHLLELMSFLARKSVTNNCMSCLRVVVVENSLNTNPRYSLCCFSERQKCTWKLLLSSYRSVTEARTTFNMVPAFSSQRNSQHYRVWVRLSTSKN